MFNIFKVANGSFFPYTKDAFTLYKQVTRQYKEIKVLDYVRQFVPENIAKDVLINKKDVSTNKIDFLKPMLGWFKKDFMKWMNKSVICENCKKPMQFQYSQGNSWKLRAIENHFCLSCKSQIIFPRYGLIDKIADTRIGRCSEWSILFGALLTSISIETRIVHDFLDHCWNESLIAGKWVHIDSTLDYPISINSPYYYEKNWHKNYNYILAFSDVDLEDVTLSYSHEFNYIKKRRSKKYNIDDFKKIYYEIN